MAHDRRHRRTTRRSERDARKQAGEKGFFGKLLESGREYGQAVAGGDMVGAAEALAGGPLGKFVTDEVEEDLGAPKQWDTLDEILAAMKRNRFARSSGYSQFFKGDRGGSQFLRPTSSVRNPTARMPGSGVGRPRRRGQMGRPAPGFGGAPQTRYGGY